MTLEIYEELAVQQLPRLLSRLDKEPFSKSYGSLDRTYWSWKFTDFQGSRFQEAVYAMSWFYVHNKTSNSLFKNPNLKQWILASLNNWRKAQHYDGSFDEAYPFERSLAATSFTSFYVGEAVLLLGDEIPDEVYRQTINCLKKCGDWLCKNDEHHGFLSNHLAAAAAALTILNSIEENSKFSKRAEYFVDKIISHQSSEGWYEEYGGADIGYQSHCIFYLARIWTLTKDKKLLKSLKSSNNFFKYFVHPNGTIGGEYASRNTSFYFPAGFEILSGVCEDASAIATFMRNSIRKNTTTGLTAMDAQNFCPMLNNYLFASKFKLNSKKKRKLPFSKNVKIWFPDAGLFINSTKFYYAIFATSKGGVLKIYNKKTKALAYTDCGYWGSLKNQQKISSQSFSRTNKVKFNQNIISVNAPFTSVKQRLMAPFLFLCFRLFMLTVGRQKHLAIYIKNLLVRVLVSGVSKVDAELIREVVFFEDSVRINDEIKVNSIKMETLDFFPGGKFSTIHMGSSRYFQYEDLDTPVLQPIELNKKQFLWKPE